MFKLNADNFSRPMSRHVVWELQAELCGALDTDTYLDVAIHNYVNYKYWDGVSTFDWAFDTFTCFRAIRLQSRC